MQIRYSLGATLNPISVHMTIEPRRPQLWALISLRGARRSWVLYSAVMA